MNNIDWLDEYPPELRMMVFLDDLFAGEDREERIAKLAAELKYARPQIVQGWTTGASKVPLKALMSIAFFAGRDVSELMPLWIAAEMKGEDGDRLYQATKRMISTWEFGLIAVARDIYRGDDDERQDG